MTFSILALDRRTGALGGAVASCVPREVVLRVYGAAPGRGALVTQSHLHERAHEDGLAWLASGRGADEVLAGLIAPAYDPDFALRQYAVVDAAGALATFSGPGALDHASQRRGEVDGLVFAVQGNLLTGPEVLDAMEAAFVEGEGAGPGEGHGGEPATSACDLAPRLLRALRAGGSDGRGDGRCTPAGVPAEAAALFVDPPPNAGAALARAAIAIDAEGPGDPPTSDPIEELAAKLAAHRAAYPCRDASGGAGGSGGAEGAGASAPSLGDAGCALGALGEPGAPSAPGSFGALLLIAAIAALRAAARGRGASRRARDRRSSSSGSARP